VTGASSGIGREIALELARQGAQVVVTARRKERLRELAEQITADGGEIRYVAGDITDPAVQQKVIETAQAEFGGLDVLVNNAGVGAMGKFEHADPGRARAVMELNFFALVEMTRRAFSLLRQGTNPIVVNVSSILGLRGVPYSSEYSASKFAVEGFSQAIRSEFAPHKIDVLVVNPGTTETEFFDKVIEKTGEPSWPEHAAVTPAHVARKTVRAIRRGKHTIIPYFWGKVLIWLQRLSPRLMDSIMARYV
jgi:short-subunit dehydrogenase